MTPLKLILSDGAKAPSYQSEGAAGMDISAFLPFGEIAIKPGSYAAIPTGVSMEIPEGYEVQVRPRSGLAFKYGVTVLNSPGTIDSDYRGEIRVCLANHGNADFVVHDGDRIAQLVLSRCERAVFSFVNELSSTQRGQGGFGSTGTR